MARVRNMKEISSNMRAQIKHSPGDSESFNVCQRQLEEHRRLSSSGSSNRCGGRDLASSMATLLSDDGVGAMTVLER